jgi:predicted DNA-binding transcriptional regulator
VCCVVTSGKSFEQRIRDSALKKYTISFLTTRCTVAALLKKRRVREEKKWIIFIQDPKEYKKIMDTTSERGHSHSIFLLCGDW